MTRRFGVEDYLSLKQPAPRVPCHLSPDGRLLAISVQSPRRETTDAQIDGFSPDGVMGELAGSRIVVVDTVSGESREPFPADAVSWAGRWSPDGKRLAAFVQHGGRACVGIWEPGTGQIELVPEARVKGYFGFCVPLWTPDSKKVVAKLWPLKDLAEEEPSANDLPVAVQSFDPDTGEDEAEKGREDHHWRADLGVIDVETGEVVRLAPGFAWSVAKMAPDGHAIAFLHHRETDEALYQLYADLVTVPLDGTMPVTIAEDLPEKWFGLPFSWSPDSMSIAFSTTHRKSPQELFIVSADGSGKPVHLTPVGFAISEYEAPMWSVDGTKVYCVGAGSVWEAAADGTSARRVVKRDELHVRYCLQSQESHTLWGTDRSCLLLVAKNNETHHDAIVRADLVTGATEVLLEMVEVDIGSHWVTDVDLVRSKCFFQSAGPHTLDEIWQVGVDGRDPCWLWAYNETMADVEFADSQTIEYQDANGDPQKSVLFLPAGYTEGDRAPLVVDVYGGIKPSDGGRMFNVYAQLLASRGYAVLYPDMPLRGPNPMSQFPGLTIPAVNRTVELGYVDPDRVAVQGQSYGAYTVLGLITQTDIFKAALAQAPCMANMTSNYALAVGLCESGQGGMGGTPWEKRNTYIENSPFFYLDRVKTPLLMVCGSEDKVACSQGKEVYVGLRRLGKRVELREYKGQGHWHGNWSARHVQDVYRRIFEWYDTYLGSSPGE